MAPDHPDQPIPLIETASVAHRPDIDRSPVIDEPSPPVSPAEPGLLSHLEKKRIETAMAGLDQFRPTVAPDRPEPRMEVDRLGTVEAADWTGLDVEERPSSRPEPPSPEPKPKAVPVVEDLSISSTDPVRGWVTADRVFADFGD